MSTTLETVQSKLNELDLKEVDVPKWTAPPPSSYELPWADILTVDLSLYDTDKDELVRTVATALGRDGFFYVVNHGIESVTVRPQAPEFRTARKLKSRLLCIPAEPAVRPRPTCVRRSVYRGEREPSSAYRRGGVVYWVQGVF